MGRLFVFNSDNSARYLTQHHIELANLPKSKPQAFSDLEAFGLGASLNGNKLSTIPGDLVTEFTINREVKVRDGPMRGGYSTYNDFENDFILNSHMFAKLRKELKNSVDLKADSKHKESSTQREIKKHEEQIAVLTRSL